MTVFSTGELHEILAGLHERKFEAERYVQQSVNIIERYKDCDCAHCKSQHDLSVRDLPIFRGRLLDIESAIGKVKKSLG